MDPADAADIITDLQSNPKMLVEFNKKPGLMDVKNELKAAGKTAATKDVETIKLIDRAGSRPNLKTKLVTELSDSELVEFSEKFKNTSEWGLDKLNSDGIDLVDYWSNNKDLLHDYHNLEHGPWPDSPDGLDGVERGLVDHANSVGDIHNGDNVNEISGQIQAEVDPKIVAVGTYDGAPSPTVRYNRKKVGTKSIENDDAAYNAAKSELDPLLQTHLDYLDFVRKDKVGYADGGSYSGEIYKGLYDNNVPGFDGKLNAAQRPGMHAEVLVVDSIIKELRANGETINSLQDLASKNVKVIVKGKTQGKMSTCPHCFTILKNLNIVINPGK